MGFFDLLFGTNSSSKPKGYSGSYSAVTQELSKKIRDDWDVVELQLRGGAPSQLKQALITADKLLDAALKGTVNGESMSERLKNSKDKFEWSFYQKIWEAHKLRNNMVHEVNFDPPHFMIREAVHTIKIALVKLGVSL